MIFFQIFLITASNIDPTANTIEISDSKQNLSQSAQSAPTSGINLGLPTSLLGGNHLDVPHNNPNLLSPDILSQRRGSRRPSILPVPDMFTSSSLSISGNEDGDEGDESDDEVDDDVPWRSPSEKIA